MAALSSAFVDGDRGLVMGEQVPVPVLLPVAVAGFRIRSGRYNALRPRLLKSAYYRLVCRWNFLSLLPSPFPFRLW